MYHVCFAVFQLLLYAVVAAMCIFLAASRIYMLWCVDYEHSVELGLFDCGGY
jgi:hypothetical protein